ERTRVTSFIDKVAVVRPRRGRGPSPSDDARYVASGPAGQSGRIRSRISPACPRAKTRTTVAPRGLAFVKLLFYNLKWSGHGDRWLGAEVASEDPRRSRALKSVAARNNRCGRNDYVISSHRKSRTCPCKPDCGHPDSLAGRSSHCRQ